MAWQVLSQPAVDRPAALVALAARRLAVERPEWGRAMLAEIVHVQERAMRWRFALGCAQVALFPPRRAEASGQILRTTVLVGAAACASVLWYGGMVYPARGIFRSQELTLLSAALLVAYLGVTFLLTRPASMPAVVARRCGLLGGAALSALLMIANTPVNPLGNSSISDGLGWLAPLLATIPLAVVAARRGRTLRAGVEAGLWSGLVSSLLVSVGLLVLTYAATGWFTHDPATIASFQSQLAWSVGDGLASSPPDIDAYLVSANEETAGILLLAGPMLSLAFGAVGGLVGVGLSSRSR
jgi:hypothetical protein